MDSIDDDNEDVNTCEYCEEDYDLGNSSASSYGRFCCDYCELLFYEELREEKNK